MSHCVGKLFTHLRQKKFKLELNEVSLIGPGYAQTEFLYGISARVYLTSDLTNSLVIAS